MYLMNDHEKQAFWESYRGLELKVMNWRLADHLPPTYAVYENGDSFVGVVEVWPEGLRIDSRRLCMRERKTLERLSASYRTLLDRLNAR